MREIKGKPLFEFAVISDTHLVVPDEANRALHSTHDLSTGRLIYLVNQLNQINPDFVIHLGDMIHPVPGTPEYSPTAEKFLEISSKLESPLHYIPGNHDLGDKYRKGMPAAVVNQSGVQEYENSFGDSYKSFVHHDCLFMLINNPLFNSGLPLEVNQFRWLESEMEQSREYRIFFMMHYPVFIMSPSEKQHYDNLDQPARQKLLNLMSKYRVEAAFSGHVHNFFYNNYGGTELYSIPSTAFVRQDYSELFRVEPLDGFGRNDLDKLGFFMVRVFEQGHQVNFVRTKGRTARHIHNLHKQVRREKYDACLPAQEKAVIGVELRHNWNEITQIPFNYILDEFVRREVRNDYPIFATWEIGISNVRVPISDLLDTESRSRVALLHDGGFRFTFFSFGLPTDEELESLIDNEFLIYALEIIFIWEDVQVLVDQITRIKEQLPFKIFLSPLEHTQDFAGSIDQYIRPGVRIQDLDKLKSTILVNDLANKIDGFTIRIGPEANPWLSILEIENLTTALDISGSIILQLASESEAGVVDNELYLAARVALGAFAAVLTNRLNIFIDTFADIDRGYYIRYGLVDRRYNLRLPGRALRNFARVLSRPIQIIGTDHGQLEQGNEFYQWYTENQHVILVDGTGARELEQTLIFPVLHINQLVGTGMSHDLLTGISSPLSWEKQQDNLMVTSELPWAQLILIILDT